MTIPAWAVKGAKCVCIDGRGTQMFGLRGGEIFEGHVYEIDRAVLEKGRPCVFLVGVKRVVLRMDATRVVPFGLRRFRPLVEDDTETQAYRKHQLHLPLSKRLETV